MSDDIKLTDVECWMTFSTATDDASSLSLKSQKQSKMVDSLTLLVTAINSLGGHTVISPITVVSEVTTAEERSCQKYLSDEQLERIVHREESFISNFLDRFGAVKRFAWNSRRPNIIVALCLLLKLQSDLQWTDHRLHKRAILELVYRVSSEMDSTKCIDSAKLPSHHLTVLGHSSLQLRSI
ncbi:unnamed protein product [Acanthocheilonema viteae]|uniref:Uncharacterized protein n=1 Tax=Acanthocheilonema viteae TaxID=6277 RepID=A0A498SCF1_ACAVI|nr:unnamed protein product [Acanthocheilonema viteae]